MDLKTVATKGNLIAAKNSLALAKQGFDLMDQKRNILIREIMDLDSRAKEVQSEIDTTFTEAYAALQQANIELGIKNVETFAFNVEPENDISIKVRSVMGTEIPLVRHEEEQHNPVYSFYKTTESLDHAKTCFEKVKDLTIKLSMIENSAYRLAYNIKKTQKRANALQNITIPNLEQTIKDITNALEEKEREEFTRLKVIKRRMAKQI
ncbi:MAG: V-type ATP synthase subunit D [Eubacterium sp.]|nr:V-type ATP synthase subunit D [Eubacterium sp.]